MDRSIECRRRWKLWPTNELRVWVSEGLTHADSYFATHLRRTVPNWEDKLPEHRGVEGDFWVSNKATSLENNTKLGRYTRSPLQDSRLFGPSPWKVLATTYDKNRFLSNPAPGENLPSGNLVMETGCTLFPVLQNSVVFCCAFSQRSAAGGRQRKMQSVSIISIYTYAYIYIYIYISIWYDCYGDIYAPPAPNRGGGEWYFRRWIAWPK